MSEGLLAGRVALVTGGSRGIGAAICRRLAEHGAAVVVNYRSNHAAAEDVAARIETAGGRVLLAPADVTDEAAVQAMVARTERELGPIDILVNNAFPGYKGGAIDELPWEAYQWFFDQMVQAAYHTIRAVLPGMKERRWGRIVNFGTTATYEAVNHHTPYTTSKGALVALTHGLARDLGPFNICVNMVSPSVVYRGPEPAPPDWGRERARGTAFGRNPTAWEVAGAVVFLASPLADAITGLQLPVCCGLLTHMG
ncbi:MAG: SDR family oxidoreductase [Chloroflexi bacterium]|nr:SDR family oxidoreductase [Chloroflexota bacterium]